MNGFKEKVIDCIKGFFIGIAFLIPGVSGATIALITKVFQKIILSLTNLFKHFLTSFITLLPIGIGVLIAIIAMWIPLKLATEHILFAIVCLFAGSMIGGIPTVTENIKNEPVKKRHYFYLILAILIGATFGILSSKLSINVNYLFNPIDYKIFLIIIPVGILAGSGIVIPGISGSMILLVLGFYKPILGLVDIMKNDSSQIGLCLGLLACMAIGVLIGIISFSVLIKLLFNKNKIATYMWILGFIFGSLFSLFYNHDMVNYYNKGVAWWEFLLGTIFLIGGLVGSYFISYKIPQKNKTIEEDNAND